MRVWQAHVRTEKMEGGGPPPPGPTPRPPPDPPPPSPSSNAGESLSWGVHSFRCNLRVKKGSTTGETQCLPEQMAVEW